MDLEGLLTQAIDQAIDEVKRKRGIQVVVHRDAVKLGGVDITDDVIRFLEELEKVAPTLRRGKDEQAVECTRGIP
jgi:hypothetical protein